MAARTPEHARKRIGEGEDSNHRKAPDAAFAIGGQTFGGRCAMNSQRVLTREARPQSASSTLTRSPHTFRGDQLVESLYADPMCGGAAGDDGPLRLG